MIKTCTTCNVRKLTGEFYSKVGGKFGVGARCKDCTNFYMRTRHARPDVKQKRRDGYDKVKSDLKFIEAARLRGIKFYSSVEGRARAILNNAKKSPAGQIECSVTLEHIIDGITKGFCCVTGISFDLTDNHQKISGRRVNPYSPSIDRIDSRKGYTNENTRIVIWQFNMMKGELTDEELRFICERFLNA